MGSFGVGCLELTLMLYPRIQAVTVYARSAEESDFWSLREQLLFHCYTHITNTTVRRTEFRDQNVSPFKALIKLIPIVERKKQVSLHMAPRFTFSISFSQVK